MPKNLIEIKPFHKGLNTQDHHADGFVLEEAENIDISSIGQIRARNKMEWLIDAGQPREIGIRQNKGSLYFRADFAPDGTAIQTEYIIFDNQYNSEINTLEVMYRTLNMSEWDFYFNTTNPFRFNNSHSAWLFDSAVSSYKNGVYRRAIKYNSNQYANQKVYFDQDDNQWKETNITLDATVNIQKSILLDETKSNWGNGTYDIFYCLQTIDNQFTKLKSAEQSVDVSVGNFNLYSFYVSSFPNGYKTIKLFVKKSGDVNGDYIYVEDLTASKTSATLQSAFEDYPSAETYMTVTGYDKDENEPLEIDYYKDIAFANNRAFLIAPRIHGRDYNDRIIYSEVNQYDTFLKYNYVDIAGNDGDECIGVSAFMSKLLVFKLNKLDVVNVQDPNPGGWYLERSYPNMGIKHAKAYQDTRYGILWVNDNGCFLYSGKLADSLSQNIDSGQWATDFVTDYASIGYIPREQKLVVIKNMNSAGNASLFDFRIKSWVTITNLTPSGITIGTPLVINSSDLYFVQGGSSDGLYKWDIYSNYTGLVKIKIKPQSLGIATLKKVYGVYLVTGQTNLTVKINGVSTSHNSTKSDGEKQYYQPSSAARLYDFTITIAGSLTEPINGLWVDVRPMYKRNN